MVKRRKTGERVERALEAKVEADDRERLRQLQRDGWTQLCGGLLDRSDGA